MPAPLVLAALAAGGAGAYGAYKSNKRRPGSVEFQPYTGYRPPRVEGLRDVEKLIRETLIRRSQGEGVGFDPARREAQLEAYDIENERALDRQKQDINDRLSGMGLSRNLKAVDYLYNRAMEDNKRDRDLYNARIDVEDLERANQERDINTARLQDLNTFNFGQDNRAADFDLNVYNSEQGNRYRSYGTEVDRFNQYQDPIGTGIQAGLSVYGAGRSLQNPTSAPQALLQRPSEIYKKDRNNAMVDALRLQQSRYNLEGR